jgi:hypothetical protein
MACVATLTFVIEKRCLSSACDAHREMRITCAAINNASTTQQVMSRILWDCCRLRSGMSGPGSKSPRHRDALVTIHKSLGVIDTSSAWVAGAKNSKKTTLLTLACQSCRTPAASIVTNLGQFRIENHAPHAEAGMSPSSKQSATQYDVESWAEHKTMALIFALPRELFCVYLRLN